jgi:hypothetical protein
MSPQIARQRNADHDLTQMVQPLASYICATDRPRTALLAAFAVLLQEVEEINGSAAGHLRSARGGNQQ